MTKTISSLWDNARYGGRLGEEVDEVARVTGWFGVTLADGRL